MATLRRTAELSGALDVGGHPCDRIAGSVLPGSQSPAGVGVVAVSRSHRVGMGELNPADEGNEGRGGHCVDIVANGVGVPVWRGGHECRAWEAERWCCRHDNGSVRSHLDDHVTHLVGQFSHIQWCQRPLWFPAPCLLRGGGC